MGDDFEEAIEDMSTFTLLREMWTASVEAVGYSRAPLAFFIALYALGHEPRLFESFEPVSQRQTTLDEFGGQRP